MQKINLELQKNDSIVHAAHGVGTVKGIVTKNLEGEKHAFYQVKTERLTYWLPVANSHSDRIRSIRSSNSFNKAISIIRRKPKELSNNFRARIKHINEELAKCSLMSSARLIRDMHGRNMTKPLHMNESRKFEKLKQQFINEWSIASDLEKDEAENKLEDALIASAKKMDK